MRVALKIAATESDVYTPSFVHLPMCIEAVPPGHHMAAWPDEEGVACLVKAMAL